jgi:hypothetical protein
MKILLANGCSNTAGSEINENNVRYCPESAWPNWVAKKLNVNWVNIAEPGSGNEQISRSTILSVSNLIDIDKFNPNNLIVCILWSGFDRYEFWSEDKDNFRSFSMSAPGKYSPPSDIVKKYIEYRSLVETTEYSYYKNLYYIYITAKFLESYKIKYYFANCMNTFVDPNSLKCTDNFKNNYNNLLNLYGQGRIENHYGFFDQSKTFLYLLKDTPRSPIGTGFHWGELGQKEYAKYFIKHMEEVDGRMGT